MLKSFYFRILRNCTFVQILRIVHLGSLSYAFLLSTTSKLTRIVEMDIKFWQPCNHITNPLIAILNF